MPLEWEQGRYGSSRAYLGHGLDLSVQWTATRVADGEPKWEVYVFGSRLEKRSPEQEHGQRRAEAVAKKWLAEALEKLV
jgi:hypothetical protein